MNNHILPVIGNMPIHSIDRDTLNEMFLSIKNKGLTNTLQKIRSYTNQVFEDAHVIPNPMNYLKKNLFKNLHKKSKQYAHIETPKEIGELLKRLDTLQGTIEVTTALKIAPYLFLRPSELTGLRWQEVDFESKMLRIKADRMKKDNAHLAPLPNQVIKLLKILESIEPKTEYVFPSNKSKSKHIRPESLRKALRDLCINRDD
ncbi:tyrosine-type recombinase/integrase [Candidatus Thiodubiliella endoseptemdiera]